jgi:ABC-type Fe3+-hydroxamate transport system substrate-binding protein
MGSSVVGITDYCIHPAEKLIGLPRLGGTKNPHIEEIVNLQPDLVLANWEENTRQSVDALEAVGIPVWVTFPKTVRQSIDILWTLAGIYENSIAAVRLETLEVALDWAATASADNRGTSYFCPIWFGQDDGGAPWWMTFNQDTYCNDVLKAVGGENVFADRQRRYPLLADLGKASPEPAGERDIRYPRVTIDEIQNADPDIVLLPNEPFEFTPNHKQMMRNYLQNTRAARENKIILVDGSLITWPGTRLAHALRDLPSIFSI